MAPRTLSLLLLTLSLGLAGCLGGGDDAPADDAGTTPTPGGGGSTPLLTPVSLEVSAVGAYPANPAFSPARLEAPVNAIVTVKFTNADMSPTFNHDWFVERIDGAATDIIAPGATTEVTFNTPSEPGEFAFWCTVPGHRDRGMEGTFVVK